MERARGQLDSGRVQLSTDVHAATRARSPPLSLEQAQLKSRDDWLEYRRKAELAKAKGLDQAKAKTLDQSKDQGTGLDPDDDYTQ